MREVRLKVRDILKLNQAIELILDNHDNSKVDTVFQFKILGIMKSLEPHIENYNAIRNEKINQYGKLDKNGNIVIAPNNQEAIEKFNDDIYPILNSEVQLNISLLKPDEVFSNNFDAKILMALYPIMEGNSQPKERNEKYV